MHISLKNKTVIITGAAQGIGKSIVKKMLNIGAFVIAIDINKDLLNHLQENLDSRRLLVKKLDVCNKKNIKNLMKEVRKQTGSIDVLVNNAGVIERSKIEEISEDHFIKIIKTNLKGLIICSQAVIPYMKQQNKGKIINACSIGANLPDIGLGMYCSSKAAIASITKVLAAELGPYNINVNAYSPGIIRTPMTDEIIDKRGDDKVKKIALRRFGEPKEVANLVVFLASEFAEYVNGAIIPIDGGSFLVQRPEIMNKII